MWHLLWQMLLKTNKKGTVDKFLNSRLVLDHICQTANTVGPTVSDFPFLPSLFLWQGPADTLCVFTDTALWLLWKCKTLGIRDCERVLWALTSLSTFNFGYPNLCFKILFSFSAIKQSSQMALSGVSCPSCCLQDLGRRQGEECNPTSTIGCGIPGFDSSSVNQTVVQMWVFECSLPVSVWIVSQRLCGMQSPP